MLVSFWLMHLDIKPFARCRCSWHTVLQCLAELNVRGLTEYNWLLVAFVKTGMVLGSTGGGKIMGSTGGGKITGSTGGGKIMGSTGGGKIMGSTEGLKLWVQQEG